MISRSKNISGRWNFILVAVFVFVIAGALLPMLPMELPWMMILPSVMRSTTSQQACAWSAIVTPAWGAVERP